MVSQVLWSVPIHLPEVFLSQQSWWPLPWVLISADFVQKNPTHLPTDLPSSGICGRTLDFCPGGAGAQGGLFLPAHSRMMTTAQALSKHLRRGLLQHSTKGCQTSSVSTAAPQPQGVQTLPLPHPSVMPKPNDCGIAGEEGNALCLIP